MDCSEVSHLLFTENRLQLLKLSALHFILTAAGVSESRGPTGSREKQGVSHPETQAILEGPEQGELGRGKKKEMFTERARPGWRGSCCWGSRGGPLGD